MPPARCPTTATEQRIRDNRDVFCSPTRIKILRALNATDLAAGDLARVIGRSRSATSQHLRILRDAGVVTTLQRGNVVRHRLADGAGVVLADLAKRIEAA